jgi:iron(III) transport system substrate-binding protein
LTDSQWKGRVGWAPSNASFQTFVTALRLLDGEDAARQWLEAMIANDVQTYDGNDALVAAVGAGEVDLGLVNHYYLYQFLKEQGESFPAENYYFPTAGAGSIVNVAGAGVLNTAENPEAAQDFIRYLLSPEGQEYFASETVEYPLASGAAASADLPPLSKVAHPDLDLSNLDDLQGTLQLLQDTGAIQ